MTSALFLDFVSSALFFLMQGKLDMGRNFLVEVLGLQSSEGRLDCFQPGQGLHPASFKVEQAEAALFYAACGRHENCCYLSRADLLSPRGRDSLESTNLSCAEKLLD